MQHYEHRESNQFMKALFSASKNDHLESADPAESAGMPIQQATAAAAVPALPRRHPVRPRYCQLLLH